MENSLDQHKANNYLLHQIIDHKKKTYTYTDGNTVELIYTLNIFYCSKRQKDKTQVKQLRQSSPIT